MLPRIYSFLGRWLHFRAKFLRKEGDFALNRGFCCGNGGICCIEIWEILRRNRGGFAGNIERFAGNIGGIAEKYRRFCEEIEDVLRRYLGLSLASHVAGRSTKKKTTRCPKTCVVFSLVIRKMYFLFREMYFLFREMYLDF